jgi:hypothetical protein
VTIVDAQSLANALRPDSEFGFSALEHFLFGPTFLVRLHACIEAWRREQRDRKMSLPVQEVVAGPGFVFGWRVLNRGFGGCRFFFQKCVF